MKYMRWFYFLLAVLILLTGACYRKPPTLPKSVPASGVAYFGNEPLRMVRIKFMPKCPKCVEAFADTDSNGRFSVSTYKTGDGIVPGEYSVLVEPYNYKHSSGSPVRINYRLPDKYINGPSDLTIKVAQPNQQIEVFLR